MNKTKIQWCDYTWTPITGCSPISVGCQKCYAHAMAKRFNGGDFSIKFHPERLKELGRLKRPSQIFVCSTSDFFHPEVKLTWRCLVMAAIREKPQHKYLFLTKRPELVSPYAWLFQESNVWLGASIENQDVALLRISDLLNRPIANRFLSVEPMLGPVDIGAYLATGLIKWVICGPETGAGARPFEYAWAADLYGQCLRYGVPFFFKGNDHKNAVRYHWKRLPMDWPEAME